MRIAYGELIGGVSGDMFIAALLDAGMALDSLETELRKIPSLRFELKATKKTVAGIRAARFEVICGKNEPSRSWKQIRELIGRAKLHPQVKNTGMAIFSRLAEAEAKVHGVPVAKVHFHEVGATDSIVDIIGAAVSARELAIDAFHFSTIPLGRSLIRSRHGPLPIPGPATMELLKRLPVEGVDVEDETVTPTGAAIISTLGRSFGPYPPVTVERIGYGTGRKEFQHRPNLFRVVLGSREEAGRKEETMLVIETNIDDMNPQLYDLVMDRLFEAGARDVFLSSIQMKKNRPATLLSVICEPLRRGDIEKVFFRETSTIGVRSYPVSRTILQRVEKKVKTRFGNITVKIVEQPDGSKRTTPEYDDLKRIARAKNIPLKLIYDEVLRGARE